MRKAQITTFIIIGIILLLVFSLVIYFYTRTSKVDTDIAISDVYSKSQSKQVDDSAGDAQGFVMDCFERSASKGIYLLAKQGGYINPRGDFDYGERGDLLSEAYFTEDAIVPYVVHGDSSNLLPFSELTDRLERFIAVDVQGCASVNSSDYVFKSPNIDWKGIDFDWSRASVDYSDIKVKVNVISRSSSEDIVVDAKFPVRVERKDIVDSYDDFSAVADLRLEKLHSIADTLTYLIASEPGDFFNLSQNCGRLSSQDKLINIYASENPYRKSQLITITDAKPARLGLSPLRFQIAVRNKVVVGECRG